MCFRLGFLGLLVLASACGRSHASDGRVTVLYPGDERIFGPFWEMPAKFMVFLPLARLDERGELVGVLARRWEHTPDFRTWTIHLRTDVRWHDGTPFTARDVVFTYRLYGHPDLLWDAPGLRTVTAVDDSTVTMTLHRALADPISTWEVFYPAHLLDTLAPSEFQAWDFWTRPVGNGPYRYVRHVPKTMVMLAANAAYPFGRPAIDTVVLKFADGTVSGLPELLSGNVDVLGWAERADMLRLRDDPRFRVTHHVGAATRGIMWKASSPLFDDARVRRALTLAIDRRELHGLLGYPEQLPLPDGPLTDAQFRRGMFPTPLPHDPVEASRLLDAAGWQDRNGDGIRDRAGRPFRFTLLVPSDMEPVAVYVQDQLGRVGIQAAISAVDLNVVRQRSRAGDFEAVLVWLDRSRDRGFFASGGAAGYRNADVDTRLDRLDTVIDPQVRDSLHAALYAIFRRDQPATVLFPGVTQYIVPTWLEGLSSPFRADPTVNMEFLKVVR